MTTTIHPLYVKGLVATASGGLLHRFIIGNNDIMQNVYFGASTGLGISVGSYLGSQTPDTSMIGDSEGLYKGKSLVTRALEIGVGSASTILISKYLTKQDNSSMISKVGIVVLSDIISELASDYYAGLPIAYLQ